MIGIVQYAMLIINLSRAALNINKLIKKAIRLLFD